MKKYNNLTKGYKIDISYEGRYLCSTDWSKTCKEAKERFIEKHKGKSTYFSKLFKDPNFSEKKLKANFSR